MFDPDTDDARLAAHRKFHHYGRDPLVEKRSVPVTNVPLAFENMTPADMYQSLLRMAVDHLDKVLNGCRSHQEQQAADKAAREFLQTINVK